jgi:hypothetical protein
MQATPSKRGQVLAGIGLTIAVFATLYLVGWVVVFVVAGSIRRETTSAFVGSMGIGVAVLVAGLLIRRAGYRMSSN